MSFFYSEDLSNTFWQRSYSDVSLQLGGFLKGSLKEVWKGSQRYSDIACSKLVCLKSIGDTIQVDKSIINALMPYF